MRKVNISLAVAPLRSLLIAFQATATLIEDTTLRFNTSQRYDFFIYDGERNLVWRWSDKRFFLEVLRTKTVVAKIEVLTYKETFGEKFVPGSYLILGIITERDEPFGNISIVTVEEFTSNNFLFPGNLGWF